MTAPEIMAQVRKQVATQKRVVAGVNEPSPPFETLYRIDLDIDFNRYRDDQRRVAAEVWCCHSTRHRWFRRILTDIGIARFEFEDLNEATMFRLAN
jgi:hypothetical protein